MTTIERKPEGQRLERLISDCFSGGEICRRELRLQEGEAQALEQAIGAKLRWFADEGGLSQLALGLRGEENPSYSRVRELEKQKQEEENSQIVQAVRSLKLTPAQLMAFLNDPKNSLTASGHTDPKPEAPEKEDTAHEEN